MRACIIQHACFHKCSLQPAEDARDHGQREEAGGDRGSSRSGAAAGVLILTLMIILTMIPLQLLCFVLSEFLTAVNCSCLHWHGTWLLSVL